METNFNILKENLIKEREEELNQLKNSKVTEKSKNLVQKLLFADQTVRQPTTSSNHNNNIIETEIENEESESTTVVLEIQALVQARPVRSLLESNFINRLERLLANESLRQPGAPSAPGTRFVQSINQPNPNIQAPLTNLIRTNQASDNHNDNTSVNVPSYAIPPTANFPNIIPWVHRVGSQVTDDVAPTERSTQNEDFQFEIRELLQARPVGNIIENNSGFRQRLEQLIADTISSHNLRSGGLSRSTGFMVPRSAYQRNDFRHLGIPLQQDDISDSVSVISAEVRSVPTNRDNGSIQKLSKEVRSIRNEMAEMKNLIKIVIDSQMEVQRSIKQEITAALNANGHSNDGIIPATSSSSTRPISSKRRPNKIANIDDDSNLCVICLEKESDMMMYSCGHLCLCFVCATTMKNEHGVKKCPSCRAPIKDIIRCYRG